MVLWALSTQLFKIRIPFTEESCDRGLKNASHWASKKAYECIISANKFLKKEEDTEKIEILATACCHTEFKQKRTGSKKGKY